MRILLLAAPSPSSLSSEFNAAVPAARPSSVRNVPPAAAVALVDARFPPPAPAVGLVRPAGENVSVPRRPPAASSGEPPAVGELPRRLGLKPPCINGEPAGELSRLAARSDSASAAARPDVPAAFQPARSRCASGAATCIPGSASAANSSQSSTDAGTLMPALALADDAAAASFHPVAAPELLPAKEPRPRVGRAGVPALPSAAAALWSCDGNTASPPASATDEIAGAKPASGEASMPTPSPAA